MKYIEEIIKRGAIKIDTPKGYEARLFSGCIVARPTEDVTLPPLVYHNGEWEVLVPSLQNVTPITKQLPSTPINAD